MLRTALASRLQAALPRSGVSSFTPFRALAQHAPKTVHCDEFGIPERPTWSVNELLSSYPRPHLENATVDRLYKLSALVPPPSDSVEYAEMKGDLEEMVRLVEAVRQVDTTGVTTLGRGEQEDADRLHAETYGNDGPAEKSGKDLLPYASRTVDGLYVVETYGRR